jgi:hypothetical protein
LGDGIGWQVPEMKKECGEEAVKDSVGRHTERRKAPRENSKDNSDN